MRIRAGIASRLLACVGCQPQPHWRREECGLKMVNTVPITMAAEGRRVLVPVTINGTQKLVPARYRRSVHAQISPEATADRLKTAPARQRDQDARPLWRRIDSGPLRCGHALTWAISRRQRYAAPIMTFGENELFSGILAADYMGEYDIELDFAGGKMNYFSTQIIAKARSSIGPQPP